jgi:hypothetical protein
LIPVCVCLAGFLPNGKKDKIYGKWSDSTWFSA